MKKIPVFCISSFLLLTIVFSAKAQTAPSAIEGRWDITLSADGKEYPSWLEVTHSGTHTLVGQFVAIVGSARPISKVNVDGSKFSFAIPPQWEEGNNDLKVEGTFETEKIAGNLTMPNGKSYSFTGVRAPIMRRQQQPAWGTPVKLFNGKDLTGWQALGANNQWVAANGILQNPKAGVNLRTEKTFTDFKLHIEFRYPKESNSGVYLRGRYEVQIMDTKETEPAKGDFGAIYGFLLPSEMATKGAGEWQWYDITLIGRTITVVANGKTIISNQQIPGITGGALDSKEGEPGPILLQGDHGPVEFRNIILTPAK